MITPPRRMLAAAFAAAGLVLAAGAPVARAVPAPEITGVFRAERCTGGPCEPGTDRGIKQGTSVRGTLQIHVAATNDLRPIEWVRLEARWGNDPQFICMQHWAVGEQSFAGYYEWATQSWPDPTINSNCIENSPHYHGEQTRNGRFDLRVVARERLAPTENPSGHDGTSNIFTLAVNNPPVAPTWVSDPTATQGDDPVVTLQWRPSAELDVVEYVIVRRDPSGRETETAIDARKPSRQGCSRLGDTAIKCTDREFGARPGGLYTYALTARRRASAGSLRCAVADGRCVESPLSEQKTVTVAGPTARGVPTPPPVASPVPSGFAIPTAPTGSRTLAPFPTPVPSATQQPSLTTGGNPAGATQSLPSRGLLGPGAFTFALGIGGWQLRRALLARR